MPHQRPDVQMAVGPAGHLLLGIIRHHLDVPAAADSGHLADGAVPGDRHGHGVFLPFHHDAEHQRPAHQAGQSGAGRIRRDMDRRHFLRKPGRPAQKHPRLPIHQGQAKHFILGLYERHNDFNSLRIVQLGGRKDKVGGRKEEVGGFIYC